MRKEREALLIAALAGLVIVGAAAFVVQPGIGQPQPANVQLGSATVLQGSAIDLSKAG